MSQNVPFPFGAHPSVATPPPTTSHTQTPTMPAPPAGGGDMASLLAGMNITPDQLAKIAYLMRTGQLTLPPPPPPALPVATPPAPPPTQVQPAPAADPRREKQAPEQHGDMDKEEGEVEEGEVDDAPEPVPRDFLRTPPKGPRKRSRSPLPRFTSAQVSRRGSQQHHSQPSPRSANGVPRTSALVSTNGAAAPVDANGDASNARKAARNAAAKEMVLKLHNHGYSFDDVAKAISNRKVLRRLYNQLGLPALSPKPARATLAPLAAALPSPVADPQRKVSQPKKAAPAKPVTVDRSEYLAKLQAAKNKKAEATAASASPIDKLGPSAPAVSKPTPAAPATGVPALAEKVASKNDLIRQRMAILAAERAAKEEAKRKALEAVSNGEVVVISSDGPRLDGLQESPKPGLGDGLAQAAIRAGEIASGHQATSSTQQNIPPAVSAQLSMSPRQHVPQQTASPTINRGFGLPGLFTTTSSPMSQVPVQQQQIAAFAPPPRPSAPSRQQSSSAFSSSTTQKRPSGQLKDDVEDRVVIVDSDEEDTDDDMDIDDDDDPDKSAVMASATAPPGPLKDFPPKPTLSKNATSVPGTPGTPGTPSQAQLKMDQEIAEMKRKIAEAESRKRRKTGSAGQAQQIPTLRAEAGVVERSQSTLTPSAETSKASLKEQREQLEQRLRALQSQGIGTGLISPPAPVVATPINTQDVDTVLEMTQPQPPVDGTLSGEDGQVSAPTNVLEVVDPEDEEIEDDYEPEFDSDPANANGQAAAPLTNGLQTTGDQDLVGARALKPDAPSTNSVIFNQRAHESNKPMQQPIIMENEDNIDDDDMDDIYADTPDNDDREVQRPAPMTTKEPDDSQDETDDAMDTSGNSTDCESDKHESEGEYEPKLDVPTSRAIQERQTTSSELHHGADLQMPMEAEQSSRASSQDDSSSSASSPPGGDAVDESEAARTNDTIADTAADTIANIIAPELQPIVEEPVAPRAEARPRSSSFKPYESPLIRFKDFRYHPEFSNTVSGGHRSLTYSNSIDPEKTICPSEAAGEECKDRSCTNQHFKDMTLSDNDLLRLIGAERTPARTQEESQRWKNGLTAVVQKLRSTNVGKDVECIASRIAEYRREFLGDPTQTLLLR